MGVENIEGLQYCKNLQELNLQNNSISDISPLTTLTNLEQLYLRDNMISDIFPLSNLTDLKYLDLGGNEISDISPLGELSNLWVLNLQRNNIIDIDSLKKLNKIGDHNWNWIKIDLDIAHNQISDIFPLIKNSGVNNGDRIDISKNPLNSNSINNYIPELKNRDVEVIWSSPFS